MRVRQFVAALLLLWAARAHANPVDAFGFGSRGVAMGGAHTAVADDGSANYYNPAGLVRGRDLRLDIGYQFVQPLLRMNGRDNDVDQTRGFAIGLVAPGAFGPFRFAFGVALWLPDQRLSRVRSLPFSEPRWVYYDNRTQRLLLSANLAVQIVPGLYVGGGLTFMSRTAGTLNLKGNIAVGDPDESSLVTQISVDLLAVRYPQVGALWEVTPNVSLGLCYRHSFLLQLDQGFRIDGDIGGGLGVPPVVENGYIAARTISSDLFQPWQLTLGGAVRLLRRLLVSVDLTWAAWSEFPVPATQVTIGHDLKQFEALFKLPGSTTYPEPRFHDIVIPRVGIEWRARDGARLAVDTRFGYSYEASPVPAQFGESSLVDSDKHTFSIGAGLELKRLRPILWRPLSIDAHLAVTYLPERAERKIDPRDPVGDYVADGVVVQVGLMLRSRF
jgi:long-chain fatty acid transport protein